MVELGESAKLVEGARFSVGNGPKEERMKG
jgi:hypothetical protein